MRTIRVLACVVVLVAITSPARAGGSVAVTSAELYASNDGAAWTLEPDYGLSSSDLTYKSGVVPVRFPKKASRVTKIRVNMKTDTVSCDSYFSLDSLNMATGETETLAYEFMTTNSNTIRPFFVYIKPHKLQPKLVYFVSFTMCGMDTFYGARLFYE